MAPEPEYGLLDRGLRRGPGEKIEHERGDLLVAHESAEPRASLHDQESEAVGGEPQCNIKRVEPSTARLAEIRSPESDAAEVGAEMLSLGLSSTIAPAKPALEPLLLGVLLAAHAEVRQEEACESEDEAYEPTLHLIEAPSVVRLVDERKDRLDLLLDRRLDLRALHRSVLPGVLLREFPLATPAHVSYDGRQIHGSSALLCYETCGGSSLSGAKHPERNTRATRAVHAVAKRNRRKPSRRWMLRQSAEWRRKSCTPFKSAEKSGGKTCHNGSPAAVLISGTTSRWPESQSTRHSAAEV